MNTGDWEGTYIDLLDDDEIPNKSKIRAAVSPSSTSDTGPSSSPVTQSLPTATAETPSPANSVSVLCAVVFLVNGLKCV